MMARARADKDALARERDRKKAEELQVCYSAGYLRFYHIVSLQFSCCDLSVREKDWHGKPGL